MGIWSKNWHKIGQNMDEMYRVSDDTWPQENFDKSQALYRHELDTWIFSKCLIWKRAWNLANFSCVQCRETPSNLTNLFSYSLCCTLFLLKRTRLGGGIPVLQIKIPFRIHLLGSLGIPLILFSVWPLGGRTMLIVFWVLKFLPRSGRPLLRLVFLLLELIVVLLIKCYIFE